MEFTEIWKILAQSGSIALLLGVAIYWFVQQNKKKDEEIKRLNEQIRQDQKETIALLTRFEGILDTILSAMSSTEGNVIQKLEKSVLDLKQFIDEKIRHING